MAQNNNDDDLVDIGGGHYRYRPKPTKRHTQQLDDFLHELNETDENIGRDFYDGLDPAEWHRRAERKNRHRPIPNLLRDI